MLVDCQSLLWNVAHHWEFGARSDNFASTAVLDGFTYEVLSGNQPETMSKNSKCCFTTTVEVGFVNMERQNPCDGMLVADDQLVLTFEPDVCVFDTTPNAK